MLIHLCGRTDLAARLAEAETLEEKLKLLRGFFFWLQVHKSATDNAGSRMLMLLL
jgi:hypothetical protein